MCVSHTDRLVGPAAGAPRAEVPDHEEEAHQRAGVEVEVLQHAALGKEPERDGHHLPPVCTARRGTAVVVGGRCGGRRSGRGRRRHPPASSQLPHKDIHGWGSRGKHPGDRVHGILHECGIE